MEEERLDRFVRLGAQVRLAQLAAEMDAILTNFPDLGKRATKGGGDGPGPLAEKPARKAKKPYRMSPAKRREAAERMRKYWAAKRQEKEAQPAAPVEEKPAKKRRQGAKKR